MASQLCFTVRSTLAAGLAVKNSYKIINVVKYMRERVCTCRNTHYTHTSTSLARSSLAKSLQTEDTSRCNMKLPVNRSLHFCQLSLTYCHDTSRPVLLYGTVTIATTTCNVPGVSS